MHASNVSLGTFTTLPARRSLIAIWITAIACLWLAFAPRVAAQAAAASDAQKSADVRRLLANDDDVVALKQQLASRAISNVDYTKQVQELTKARTAILAAYDRVGQRDLTALYNAAKKDLAQVAADAKKKATADAQAKAAADREVKKQAAARDVEAKAEATRQAAAAQVKAVEDDAQTYTRLVLQHDELVFKESMQKISASERTQMPALSGQGAEIKKKYAAGGLSVARSAEFQKRLTELSQEIVQPAVKRWTTDAFPEPATVATDFSPETKRAAALIYLGGLLGERVAAPQPDATREKIARYQGALVAINPAYRDRFAAKAKDVYALAQNAEFHLEVIKKYLPAYLATAHAEVAQAKHRAEAEKQAAEAKALVIRTNIGLMLIGLGLFALPLLLILKGDSGPRLKPEQVAGEAVPLPPALRRISVFRKDYDVSCESGILYDREVWTETNVSTTTSGGGSYVAGGMVHSQPVSTSTHVSTTVYHRYWLRTLDGRETWRRFSDDVFQASKGQVVSTVDWGTGVLLAFNHHTGQLATLKRSLAAPNRLSGRKLWFINLGAWGVGFLALGFSLTGSLFPRASAFWSDLPMAGTIMVAIGSAIYIGILKIIVQTTRNAQFNRKYVPEFRRLLQESTPELLKRFSTAPTPTPS